jgi:hypothetical protein
VVATAEFGRSERITSATCDGQGRRVDMDGIQFDSWTKGLAKGSRRSVLRAAGVAALAAAFGVGAAGQALACTKDGKSCDPKKRGQCCSGTCKKTKNGRGTCTKDKEAKGCTVNDDACALDEVTCPDAPDKFCVVLDSGKPFCAGTGVCFDCDSDADCDAQSGQSGGKCIKHCPACADMGSPRACVFKQEVVLVTGAPRRQGLLP